LATENLKSLSSADRTAALRRASALIGCLIHAAEIVIDELLDDITSLRSQEDTGATDIEDTWVLSQLPTRFAARYTPLFAQKFLVALGRVPWIFTPGWCRSIGCLIA
jgi:hypothetical protein